MEKLQERRTSQLVWWRVLKFGHKSSAFRNEKGLIWHI